MSEGAPVAELGSVGAPAILGLWQQQPQAGLRVGTPQRTAVNSLARLSSVRIQAAHPLASTLEGFPGFGLGTASDAYVTRNATTSALAAGASRLADLGLLCQSVAAAQPATATRFGESLLYTPTLASYLGAVARLAGLAQMAARSAAAPSAHEASVDQLRSGYTGMQTDVGSMRRLRVTKGVYLPSDTPMHGIFGSKDVIHSWAIPGLGVKIDCIPGYSSHRRLLLRWRGLF